MVTKLVLSSEITEAQVEKVFRDFNERTDIYLHEHVLTQDSPCGKYEYVYAFLDTEKLITLKNVLIDNSAEIFNEQDYTPELLSIVNNNNTESFKETMSEDFILFEEIIKDFKINNLDKDHILDKMLDLGKDALTETDLKILNA
jgi:hypothetical protein